jgi:hypothetical protein
MARLALPRSRCRHLGRRVGSEALLDRIAEHRKAAKSGNMPPHTGPPIGGALMIKQA